MEQSGYIYAIGAENGFVKIGYTTNLASRLSHLRANNCMALTGLGYVAASKHHEAELHGLLASERERNEWFQRGRLVEHFISQLAPWPIRCRWPSVRDHRNEGWASPENDTEIGPHPLVPEIDAFLAEFGIGEHRFGILAAKNGRVVERLRAGGRIWPENEERIREFMSETRKLRYGAAREGAA